MATGDEHGAATGETARLSNRLPGFLEKPWEEYPQVVLRGTPWIRKSRLAATALQEMPARPSDEQEALIADIYDSIRGGGCHSKYTEPHRLQDVDRQLAKVLAARGSGQAIRIHDMAASNAITSLEMFEYLRDRHPVSVRATDYYDRLHVVAVRDRWRVAFDAEFRPVQYIGPSLMVCARRPEPRARPVDTIIKPALQSALLPPALAVLARSLDGSSGQRPAPDDQCRQMTLFHPRCAHLAGTDKRFSLGRDDIFSPTPDRYDVVRVANALSTDFMSEARVLDGVRAVSTTLVDGGLLVLARNARCGDGPACGTIFARRHDRLIPVADVSDGYRHREAVLQFALL